MTTKVALFVCYDLPGLLILNRVVPAIKQLGIQPIIFNTRDMRNRRFKVPTPSEIAFYNVGLLRDTIIPNIEKSSPSDGVNLTYRQLAEVHGLEYYEIEDVNAPDVCRQIQNIPDLIGAISARFLQIFNDQTIETIKSKGFFWNLHSGLLPHYKGLLTPYASITNGESTYGMTLHEMSAGIDEGGIIETAPLPLTLKPVLDLYIDLVPEGSRLITQNLLRFIEQGKVSARLQPVLKPRGYYCNPTEEQYEELKSSGILYANPNIIPHAISSLFATSGSLMNLLLERKIRASISNHIKSSLNMPEIITQAHAR